MFTYNFCIMEEKLKIFITWEDVSALKSSIRNLYSFFNICELEYSVQGEKKKCVTIATKFINVIYLSSYVGKFDTSLA